MKYNLYFYDDTRKAVIMTDMDCKQLVIDCDKVEEQVVFDEPADAGILAWLAWNDPEYYVSIALRPGGLQDYVDVWNELNWYRYFLIELFIGMKFEANHNKYKWRSGQYD